MSMSNLEINKNTNLKLYEAVRTGSSASQTVPFPSTTCNEKDWVEHSKHWNKRGKMFVELIEGLYSICGSLFVSLNSNISRVCCFPYIVCIALNSPGFWQKVKAPKGSLIPQSSSQDLLTSREEPINPSINVFFHSYLIFLLLKFDACIKKI